MRISDRKILLPVLVCLVAAALIVYLFLRGTDQPQTPTDQTSTFEPTAQTTPEIITSASTAPVETTPEPTLTSTATTLTETTATSTPATSATTVASRFISQDKAEQIALEQIGTSAQIRSVETDFDDNPPVYEIELVDANYHYSIEIHAVTGAILEFEKDEPSDDD